MIPLPSLNFFVQFAALFIFSLSLICDLILAFKFWYRAHSLSLRDSARMPELSYHAPLSSTRYFPRVPLIIRHAFLLPNFILS